MQIEQRIKMWLSSASPFFFNLYCMVAAFSTYFCMYGFRKPFLVGVFDSSLLIPFFPLLSLKVVYITAQLLGYTLSKFLGIKIVSETTAGKRTRNLLLAILIGELALGLFAFSIPW